MGTSSPNGPGITTVLSPSAGSCVSPDASSIGMNSLTLSVVTLGGVWDGWADEQRWSGYGSPEIPLHYHALLKYQNVPAPEAVAALWKAKSGDAQVEAYNAGGGAAYYIAKMFPYEDTRYDMGGLEHFTRSQECHHICIQ